MKVIGITGGVGSGKSEVLRIMEEQFGCRIIRTDDVAKELCRKGKAAYIQVVKSFGADVLDGEGEIDRKKLADIIFQDPSRREQLNHCIHPEVFTWLREEMTHLKAEGKVSLVAVEAALAKELQTVGICDEIWYVYADPKVRRERLKASRGYSDEKIDAMFAAQLSEEAFQKACSETIDNSGDLDSLTRQLTAGIG